MEEVQAAQGGGSKLAKLLPVVFFFATLGVAITSTVLVYLATYGHIPKTITEDQLYPDFEMSRLTDPSTPSIYMFDAMSANLGGTPARSIQIQVGLHMLDEEGFEEVGSKVSLVQDHIIRLINESTYDELQTIQGKLFLKHKISEAINADLKESVIKNVYFAQFVMH